MKLSITFPPRALLGSASALVAVGVLSLAACGGGSKSDSSTVTVQGDVPIAYAKRVNTIGLNPTNGVLTIAVPKREEVKPKKIQVAVS